MLFTKPKDIRYVDMAIWIDNNMYREDVDDNQLFEYLWHLALMLARKNKYFNKASYYEDFAVYFATDLFFRIKNPKQFDDNSKMTKIKSILNYMKSTIYPRKVSFEQQYYSQIVTPSIDDEDVQYDVQYSFADRLSESVDELARVEFNTCLKDINKTVKQYLKTIPYYSDKVTWYNIYLSCMLTIINSITITKREYDRIAALKYKDMSDAIEKVWKNQMDDIILFHLDDSMSNYIKVLVKRIQKLIAQDLSSCLNSYIPSVSGMSYLALSEINNISKQEWGENEN